MSDGEEQQQQQQQQQQQDDDDNDDDDDDKKLHMMTRNEYFLSPDQHEDGTTPTRVLSHHSLAGEDIMLSARPPSYTQIDVDLSPFTPSEGTRTPPTLQMPTSLTPPPLTQRTQRSQQSPQLELQLQLQLQPGAAAGSVGPQQPVMATSAATATATAAAAAAATTTTTTTTATTISATGASAPGSMRPPRGPQVSLQSARGASTGSRHGRGLSNSDYSFLSALTEGTVGNSMTMPKRRTVSWDNNDAEERDRRVGAGAAAVPGSPGGWTHTSIRSTPASILQPILNDRTAAPPVSIVTEHRLRSSASQDSFVHKSTDTLPPVSSLQSASNNAKLPPTRGQSHATAKTQTIHHLNAGLGMIWNPLTGPDTGSFIMTSPTSGEQGRSSLNHQSSPRQRSEETKKRYSIDEVMDAYPAEPHEESLLMNQIESKDFSNDYQRNGTLLSDVPPDILNIMSGGETGNMEGKRKQASGTTSSTPRPTSKNSDSFHDIANKLLGKSPPRETSGHKRGTEHHRTKAEVPHLAGEKMYEAAETLFGKFADSIRVDEENKDSVDLSIPKRRFLDLGRRTKRFRTNTRRDLTYFAQFLGPHRPTIQAQFVGLARWLMFPSLVVAVILFYGLENPPTGYNEDDAPIGDDSRASASWWFIFVGVRQVLTLELARFTQLVLIDFFTLRTRAFPRFLGPSLSLLVAQAKGWPFIIVFWALWDLSLLYGDRNIAQHWLYWQDLISMMNETNPDGGVTSDRLYHRLIYSALGVGIAVSLKRAVLGQIVGKRVVRNYRTQMARLMQKLIIMNEVSQLALRMTKKPNLNKSRHSTAFDNNYDKGSLNEFSLALDINALQGKNKGESFDYSDALSTTSHEAKGFTSSAQVEMTELLEEWEEPELEGFDEEIVTMGTILQFRRSLEFISGEYPFSQAFGSVQNRADCISSAQDVFERLIGDSAGPFLDFEVLCVIAKDKHGNIDRAKVKDLVRIFRPNRNGQLSKLDFVKSIDSVYKNLRLLLASLNNSTQIDKAYERIVNTFFAVVIGFAVMGIMGVDIGALIIGVSSVIVSFAFMIGSASAKYLEGILFVLARKPFDIGDRVNIDEVMTQADNHGGEASWIIEKVDLYTTTARLGTTRELATFSNGSLADMRITNMNRSEKPNVYLYLKFSVDTTMQQRLAFKRRITDFVKERPREWVKVVSFRSIRVEADLNYVEYVLILQHRERWQNLNAVLTSRGQVFNFSVELQKELNMRYMAPHVPVDIRMVDREEINRSGFSRMPASGVGSDFVQEEAKKDR